MFARAGIEQAPYEIVEVASASYPDRGTFTVDGVMAHEGLRPTELNPRFGAGIGVLARGLQGLPLGFVDLMVAQGEEFAWRPEELETAIIETSRRNPVPAAGLPVPEAVDSTSTLHLHWEDGELAVGDEEDAMGSLSLGPSNQGGYLRLAFDAVGMKPGEPTAPHAAQAFALASARWDLGLPPLRAATAVR